jgi:nitrite reductase/ring-hydroxylating ferredoxin subunit
MQPTLRFATILLMQSLDSEPGNSKHQKREGEIIAIGRVGDVPPGRVATVALANRTELALYNINGEFYAIENFCPHKGAPLADGHLCDHTVECDWHGWRFDLRTGQCLTKGSAVETYEVIIEDGWIKIRGLKISAVVADSFDGAGGEGLFT